jgi:two-component system sensor histidine kinase YesM
MTLALFLPEDEALDTLHTLELWYWIFFLLVLFFIIGYSLFFTRLLKKPMDDLIRSFGRIEGGDFDISIAHRRSDELGYLQDHFLRMVENLRILIDQVYRQKILAQKAELKQLQSQINPHFLYNSFFILRRKIAGKDYENADRFSQQLGQYFKYITRNDSDEVGLAKEVDHARVYSEIQSMRFSNRIRVDFAAIPAGLEGFRVPRLILQPILENAFEHGLSEKKRDGVLRVGISWEDRVLAFTVEDNGDGLTDEALARLERDLSGAEPVTEITGMINIHHRIQLRYGPASGLSIARSNLGGLKVTISIHPDGGT